MSCGTEGSSYITSFLALALSKKKKNQIKNGRARAEKRRDIVRRLPVRRRTRMDSRHSSTKTSYTRSHEIDKLASRARECTVEKDAPTIKKMIESIDKEDQRVAKLMLAAHLLRKQRDAYRRILDSLSSFDFEVKKFRPEKQFEIIKTTRKFREKVEVTFGLSAKTYVNDLLCPGPGDYSSHTPQISPKPQRAIKRRERSIAWQSAVGNPLFITSKSMKYFQRSIENILQWSKEKILSDKVRLLTDEKEPTSVKDRRKSASYTSESKIKTNIGKGRRERRTPDWSAFDDEEEDTIIPYGRTKPRQTPNLSTLRSTSNVHARNSGSKSKLLSYAPVRGLSETEKIFESLKQIEVDLPRTFTSCEDFESPAVRDGMRFILQNFVVYRPDIGFTQGMSYIAGQLLTILGDREKAFVCFANLICTQSLFRAVFGHKHILNKRVRERIELVKLLLAENCPSLLNHLDHIDFSLDNVVLKWILSLFGKILDPGEALNVIWDHFIIRGEIAFYQATVALLIILRKDLEKRDFAGCQDLLREKIKVEEIKSKELEYAIDAVECTRAFRLKLEVLSHKEDSEHIF